ncbi:MAG: molybdopterin-dependent oxidoreductase [Actinobacteria bacterium]|nr:molybdopterin-dependent oxidoreductase [Actinomycetota bacterium]
MSAQGAPPAVELVTVTVDGRELEVPKGTGMVETAARAGIEIPVFCYEPRLGPAVGACRMCLCEIEGMPKLQAACTLAAQDGLVLRTAQTSEKAAEAQRGILEFILLNHPLDCPDCDKGGECPLQDLTFRWGPGNTRMHFPKRTFDKPIPISPVITLDRERCILCYRCTRFSEGVAEDGQLVAKNRGAHSIIDTFEERPYRGHFSGNVTELCPVGALLPATYRFRARPWEIDNVPTVCTLCPVGCNVWATTREGRVQRILSRNHPEIDDGWLCDKGRFVHDHVQAPDRIREPLRRVRRRGFDPVPLDEALDVVADGLRAADGSVVLAYSGSETVEIATALARLVRQGLGSDVALLPDRIDTALDAYRAPIAAIQDAEVCLVVGDDPVVERAPLVDLWLRAARRRGADVITVHPAGDVAVPPGHAAAVCAALAGDAPPSELRDASERLRGAARVALVWSGDDETGGSHLAALARALDLGEGCGAYFLPRTPNGRGVADAWNATGEGATQTPPEEGEIGALIVSGDEAASDPRVRTLAERARFVLTTAMFMGDHTLWSHVVLPGTSYLERDGTTVNLEGRRQRLHRTVPPPVPDELEWLSELGDRFGVPIQAWATGPLPPDQAELPERTNGAPSTAPPPAAVLTNGHASGLELLTYRSLFSGPAVERVEALQFQRPYAELELSYADAEPRGIRTGDGVVAVSPNGISRELTARVNRRLRAGVVRVPSDHAEGLEKSVEVSKV